MSYQTVPGLEIKSQEYWNIWDGKFTENFCNFDAFIQARALVIKG